MGFDIESPGPGGLRISGWVFLVKAGDTHHMALICVCQMKATVSQGLSPAPAFWFLTLPPYPLPAYVGILRCLGSKRFLADGDGDDGVVGVQTLGQETVALWGYIHAPRVPQGCIWLQTL